MAGSLMTNLRSIYKNREFAWEMAIRELRGLHHGAVFGWAWLLARPLIQTGAYILIVSFIFKKTLSEGSGTFDYAIYVLSGMIAWQLITIPLERAPQLIRLRMDLVKQVIYPLETLPVTGLVLGGIILFGFIGLGPGDVGINALHQQLKRRQLYIAVPVNELGRLLPSESHWQLYGVDQH